MNNNNNNNNNENKGHCLQHDATSKYHINHYEEAQVTLKRGSSLTIDLQHVTGSDGQTYEDSVHEMFSKVAFSLGRGQKCRLVLHHCVVIFFWSSGIMDCMLFTFEEFCSCARGVNVLVHGIFLNRWWISSLKSRLLFSHEGYVSWGLSLFSVWIITFSSEMSSICPILLKLKTAFGNN